ncbi:hypothetical protein K3759_11110 [Sulfitobacter sp. W027]|uniref:hypothetical protein n=1 Tax=Sulfitobacter sp. W027 TaxID=2867025 RepID=UPI0021A3D601|nr:hypothetical protein [Sulfitobacter sp. W027]UWR32506.1 hypothetical protein K3759_11110 [Sulfitobacter sp. W027]
MTDPHTRITKDKGKWHVMARRTAQGAAEGVWVSLGGCACQMTAVRLWLACLTVDKR